MQICNCLKLLILVGVSSTLLALQPSGATPSGEAQLQYVDVADPTVLTAARFAADKIQRGNLYKTILAQKQTNADGAIYVLTIEVVDAHLKHHRYSVQVFIPVQGNKWQVIYFTPADH